MKTKRAARAETGGAEDGMEARAVVHALLGKKARAVAGAEAHAGAGMTIRAVTGIQPSAKALAVADVAIQTVAGMRPGAEMRAVEGAEAYAVAGMQPGAKARAIAGTTIQAVAGMPPSAKTRAVADAAIRTIAGMQPSAKTSAPKRLFLLLTLAFSCLCLCGCGYPPMERQTFPICLSIDPTADGGVTLGIQAPKNGQSSGVSSLSDYNILSATGDTVADALHLLAGSTPYPLNFSQLRLCLLSYELAATVPLRPLISYLTDLPTMRPNAFVMIAMGGGLSVMEAQKPDFGMRLSTHLNLLFERLYEEDMLPDSTLSTCVRDLESGMRDPLLCVCAVNPQLLPEEEKEGQGGGSGSGGGAGGSESGSSGDTSAFAVEGQGGDSAAFAVGEPWSDSLLPEELLAGALPHTSNNPVEYLGAAVVSNDRVSGVLTARETQLVLHAWYHASRRVALRDDGAQLQLFLPQGSLLADERDAVEDVLQKLQALGSDALGFGGVCSRGFSTNAEWTSVGFARIYKEAELWVGAE